MDCAATVITLATLKKTARKTILQEYLIRMAVNQTGAVSDSIRKNVRSTS
jgi:hypothetical protein